MIKKLLLAIIWPVRAGLINAANIAEGVYKGALTRKSDAAWSTRYLLVKSGTDADHVALCGVADVPQGICDGSPEAAEEHVAVQLLGATDETRMCVASAAISIGDEIVPAASGKVRTLPVAAGTYNVIGRALNEPAADGDILILEPSAPTPRVVT